MPMRRNGAGDALARRRIGSHTETPQGQSRDEIFEEVTRKERVETAKIVRREIGKKTVGEDESKAEADA